MIRGVKGARSHLGELEELSDEELERLQEQFSRLRGNHLKARRSTAELLTSEE